jgi:cytochrome c1
MAADPIEWDALAYAVKAEAASASRTAPGPDLSSQACACGRFGPWGDGKTFYCEQHVPPECRYAGQFFAEMME